MAGVGSATQPGGAVVEKGFTFIPGDGAFNDDSAFHSAGYLAREWSRFFTPVEHRHMGLCGYQDISVWNFNKS